MTKSSLIALGFALLLAGCGGKSESAETSSATTMTPLERGAILYKRCRACHTLDEGGRHRVGPNLWGVFGSEAGTKDGFNYSQAMANSGVIWSDKTISAYLEKPQEFIKGNRMSFAGLREVRDREAVIAYLRTQTGAPMVDETDP